MNYLSFLIHSFLAVHYAYGIYYYMYNLKPPIEIRLARESYGGQYKYLTFINMLLQCAYFIWATINDVFGSNSLEFKKASMLQKMRDFLFMTLTFSVGMFVSVSFWGLWAINRDLIFPKIFDSFFPAWLNHNIHTTPAVGAILEMIICPHIAPSSTVGVCTVLLGVAFYMSWICFIAFKSGHWVYPILEKLPVIGRAAFMVGMAILLYLFYVIGEKLNSMIWGKKKSKKNK